MAERASEQVIIDASAEACMSVIIDFERYPDWATDIKSVSVQRRDDDGRGGRRRVRWRDVGQAAQAADVDVG